MNEKEQQYEQIEQYLNGSLPANERLAFENELRQDPALARELTLHRQLQEAILREAPDSLMAQALGNAANTFFTDELLPVPEPEKVAQKARNVPFWYWMAASISLALLVGGGAYFLNSRPSVSPQALYASNFSTYEAPVLFRSGEKEEVSMLKAAFVEYNRKEYRTAADLFAKTLQEKPGLIVPQFYIGQCELALKQPEKAIPSFGKVIAHGDNAYVMQAKWYLALAYLATGKQTQAIPLLRELSQQNSAFSEQANRILEELTNN